MMRRAATVFLAIGCSGALSAAIAVGCSSDDPVVPPPDSSADVIAADVVADADAGSPCVPFVMPASCGDDGGVPDSLECTGLYGDFANKTLACDVREFAPAFPLWSDGAIKRRFAYLPPGSKIDVTDVDDWTFPAGTKTWKQFSIATDGGVALVETRMFWKAPDKLVPEGIWKWTTYVWSTDGKTATRNDNGVLGVRGTTYDIPTHAQCDQCHAGRQDKVLGLDAILSSAPEATGLTYGELLSTGRLTTSASGGPPAASALQIPGKPGERAALGYLHSNCGVACHNATSPSPANLSGLHLKLKSDALGSVAATDTVATGANKKPGNNWPSQPPAPDGGWYAIHPGDVARSLVPARMAIRDLDVDGGRAQMPPLVSHQVDDAGVAAVTSWIQSMTVDGGYPAPAP